jgi:hypothetical protein
MSVDANIFESGNVVMPICQLSTKLRQKKKKERREKDNRERERWGEFRRL